jgi:hypothetical protein
MFHKKTWKIKKTHFSELSSCTKTCFFRKQDCLCPFSSASNDNRHTTHLSLWRFWKIIFVIRVNKERKRSNFKFNLLTVFLSNQSLNSCENCAHLSRPLFITQFQPMESLQTLKTLNNALLRAKCLHNYYFHRYFEQ